MFSNHPTNPTGFSSLRVVRASALALLSVLACSGGKSDDPAGAAGQTTGGSASDGGSGERAGSAGAPQGGSASAGRSSGGKDGLGGRGGTAGTAAAGEGAAPPGGGNAGAAGDTIGNGGSGTSESCAKPVFTTSDHDGGFSDGGYYLHNNMWNSDVTLGPETLYACSYRDWYVVSRQTNEAGAVKTYPNVHKDYEDVPLSSFKSLTSTFAAASPHVGIYDVAYDIWLNGVATSGSTEIMIWTENFNQVPAGEKAATATFGAQSFEVWRTSNGHYLAFVPNQPLTSGSLDLKALFDWTTGKGWLSEDSTLGQVCFGVEIVSTDGKDARFQFSDFSITED